MTWSITNVKATADKLVVDFTVSDGAKSIASDCEVLLPEDFNVGEATEEQLVELLQRHLGNQVLVYESMVSQQQEAPSAVLFSWLTPPSPNPLAMAEKHVARHFSATQLLQCKVWWDELPREDTPKLAAVYQWTNGVTLAAGSGATIFDAPPHTFEELVAECVALQQQ
jgi:hypothetical protein